MLLYVGHNKCICVIGFLKWLSVTKSAKLFKNVTEKRDLKQTISHFRSRAATEILRTEFRDWK